MGISGYIYFLILTFLGFILLSCVQFTHYRCFICFSFIVGSSCDIFWCLFNDQIFRHHRPYDSAVLLRYFQAFNQNFIEVSHQKIQLLNCNDFILNSTEDFFSASKIKYILQVVFFQSGFWAVGTCMGDEWKVAFNLKKIFFGVESV